MGDEGEIPKTYGKREGLKSFLGIEVVHGNE